MKIKVLLLLVIAVFSLSAMAADNVSAVFTLDHQMSQACEKKIKSNLRFEKGVSNIAVSLKDNTITINYNPEKNDSEKLLKAFKKIGFNAFLLNSDGQPVKSSTIPKSKVGAKAKDVSKPATLQQ